MRGAVATLLVVSAVVFAGCSFVKAGAGPNTQTEQTAAESMTVRIVRVEDGDTYWFRNESGNAVGIRLIGVDTPEVRGRNYPIEYEGIPDTEAGRSHLYEWGKHITKEMRERLVGETVRLEFDSQLPKRGYYDRLVAYVYLNGTLVNRDLIASGYARVYPSSFDRREAFVAVESDARRANRGIWNYTGNSTDE
jgi:micrococcal nuclease